MPKGKGALLCVLFMMDVVITQQWGKRWRPTTSHSFFFSKDLHVTSACCVAYFSIQYVRLLCSYRRGRGARIERHAKAGFYSRMLRRFYWLPNCETLLRCGWTGLFLLEGRGENSATPWSYADYVTCWWNADFFFPYGTNHAKNDRINRFCF